MPLRESLGSTRRVSKPSGPKMQDFALKGNGDWIAPQMQIVRGMSALDMHMVFDSNVPDGIRRRILEPMDRAGGYATFAYHPTVAGNYPKGPLGSCVMTRPSVLPSSVQTPDALEFLIAIQKAYKGRHVGCALIAHSLEVAARHNVGTIFGFVDFANTGMDSFCKRIRAVAGKQARYTIDRETGMNVLAIPTDREVVKLFKEKVRGTVYKHK